MKRLVFGFVLVALHLEAYAQTPQTFDTWFEEQVAALIREASVDLNNNDPRRQREAPAADPNSTSLVDQSSASDFVSLALSVLRDQVGTIGSTTTGSTATGSVTVSAYSLLALASRTDLTDPTFYKEHTGARRVYLTIGTAASTQAEDNTTKDATVLGVKYLLSNQRDLYARGNLEQLEMVQEALKKTALARAQAKDEVQRLIFTLAQPAEVRDDGTLNTETFAVAFSDDNFPKLLALLTPAHLEQVRTLLKLRLQPFQLVRTALEAAHRGIRNRAQFAVAYTGKLRKDEGYNDHQFTIIYDHGLTDRLSWTVNAVGDVRDRRTSDNVHGARLAMEFLGQLTSPGDELWGRTPMTLSISGEAQARDSQKPTFTFQAKLTIPISTGIDLPVIYRFANRTPTSEETDPEARLGITIDTGRLAQLFR
jgi:hypothetical protein